MSEKQKPNEFVDWAKIVPWVGSVAMPQEAKHVLSDGVRRAAQADGPHFAETTIQPIVEHEARAIDSPAAQPNHGKKQIKHGERDELLSRVASRLLNYQGYKEDSTPVSFRNGERFEAWRLQRAAEKRRHEMVERRHLEVSYKIDPETGKSKLRGKRMPRSEMSQIKKGERLHRKLSRHIAHNTHKLHTAKGDKH